MVPDMAGISLDVARDVALYVALGAVVVAVVVAMVVRAVVSKLITVVALAALVIVVWTQRLSLQDCAADVRDELAAGATNDTRCTFFGRDVTVPAARS